VRLERGGRFLDLVLLGRRVVEREGVFGEGGNEREESFWTENRARAAFEARIASCRAEGWSEPNVLAVPDAPRNAELEAAVRADRSGEPHDVYADWLQGHGNPVGELVAVARALDRTADKDERSTLLRRVAALHDELGLASADDLRARWTWGLWRELVLENQTNANARARDDFAQRDVDAAALARHAFAQTVCCALVRLRIGMLGWDPEGDIPQVLAEAGRHAWAAELERLVLGPHDGTTPYAIGLVGDALSAFRGLRELVIASRDRGELSFGLVGIDLPVLERLELGHEGLSRLRWLELLDAKLPNLRMLRVAGAHDDRLRSADLAPLLAGTAFPRLLSLELPTSNIAGIARAIAESRLAAQLEKLDLYSAALDDEDARELARGAFPALKELRVGANRLTEEGSALLRRAFPGLEISGSQRD
jgi:hypothetical protein